MRKPTEADEICENSKRVDGKKHSWVFMGDDPYVKCHYCSQVRDAIHDVIYR